VADILVDKSYEIDSIMDEKHESFENKEKAKLILAQIQDKITSKYFLLSSNKEKKEVVPRLYLFGT